MKENQTVKPVIAPDFSTVSFEVREMETLVLHMDKLHPDIIRRAACVGFAQVRIVDAAAIPATDKDGNIIPADERTKMKHEKMAALIAHYETGTAEWSRVSEGGAEGGLLAQALKRLYPDKSDADIAAFLEPLTAKQAAALREDDAVAPHIAAIKAERAARKPAADKPDTKSLLAGLATAPTPAPAA